MAHYMYSKEEQLYKVIIVAVLLLALITGYFIYSITRNKNRMLRWQKARIKAEIDTLENERKRIAGDLHDELGPILSAVKLQINHLEPEDETEKIVLEKSSSQIDEIIQRFREISYDLLPNTLVRKGLTKAVDEFIGKMSDANKIKFQFKYPGGLIVQKEKEINIYRIIQEIIHNTIKHARASNLVIELQQKNNLLILQTEDDGIGFNYKALQIESSGLGLLNIQSRVSVLNAQLTVNSEPGKGTSFQVIIPS